MAEFKDLSKRRTNELDKGTALYDMMTFNPGWKIYIKYLEDIKTMAEDQLINSDKISEIRRAQIEVRFYNSLFDYINGVIDNAALIKEKLVQPKGDGKE